LEEHEPRRVEVDGIVLKNVEVLLRVTDPRRKN
jgi:hypothetical protein